MQRRIAKSKRPSFLSLKLSCEGAPLALGRISSQHTGKRHTALGGRCDRRSTLASQFLLILADLHSSTTSRFNRGARISFRLDDPSKLLTLPSCYYCLVEDIVNQDR